MDNNAKLYVLLKNFESAAWLLYSQWLRDDDDNGGLMEEDYPFAEDFGELCNKISKWVDKQNEVTFNERAG